MFFFYNFEINSFILSLLTFILFLNLSLFFLDDFFLSKNKYIRLLQILTPLWLILFVILLFNIDIFTINNNAILHLEDLNSTINIGGNIEVNKDAAEALGRNIGVAGTIAGISGAVAKAIGKSSMPPLQKAGVILGSAGVAGAIHIGTTTLNKVLNSRSSSNKNASEGIGSNNINTEGVNKLLDEGFNNLSELKILLLSMNTLASTCLFLTFILLIIILFKYYLDENKVKLNHILGNKLNNYLIKIIKLNKKTNSIYIFVIFIVLFISLSFECYFITQLYDNLDKFIELHLKK